MHPIVSNHPKPGATERDRRTGIAIWTAIGALAATALLGIAAPKFAGHAQAKPETAAPRPLTAPHESSTPRPVPAGHIDRSVPTASDAFATPLSSSLLEMHVSTF